MRKRVARRALFPAKKGGKTVCQANFALFFGALSRSIVKMVDAEDEVYRVLDRDDRDKTDNEADREVSAILSKWKRPASDSLKRKPKQVPVEKKSKLESTSVGEEDVNGRCISTAFLYLKFLFCFMRAFCN